MWTPLRKEISQLINLLTIPDERFMSLPMQEWKEIQNKIFDQFCYTGKIGWIWERLKGETYGVQFHYNYPFDQLLHLVDQKEKVYLFLDETVSERTKYWIYEGCIKDIVSIVLETKQLNEIYIASREYEWLLCVNHHNYIIATGKTMTKKLMKLERVK